VPSQYFMDGVCLSETGMSHIKSLSLERVHVPRCKKPRAKPRFFPPFGQVSTVDKDARLVATIESVVSAAGIDMPFEMPEEPPEYREGMEVPRGEDGRPPEPPEGFTIYTTESGALILRRKRTRNLQRMGKLLVLLTFFDLPLLFRNSSIFDLSM